MSLLSIFTRHIYGITTNLDDSLLKTPIKNKYIFYSSFLYLLPLLTISGSSLLSNLIRILLIVQTIASVLADYYYSGIPHISHGIDRILACLTYFITIYFFIKSTNIIFGTLLSVISIYFIYKSKQYILENKKQEYVYYHVLWHIVSSMCLTLAYYFIDL